MNVFFLLGFLPLFLLGTSPAFAATSPNASQATPATADVANDCGLTVKDNLIPARQVLAAGDSASDHAALACLIAAVQKLNAQSPTNTRSDGDRVLSVPITSTRLVKP